MHTIIKHLVDIDFADPENSSLGLGQVVYNVWKSLDGGLHDEEVSLL